MEMILLVVTNVKTLVADCELLFNLVLLGLETLQLDIDRLTHDFTLFGNVLNQDITGIPVHHCESIRLMLLVVLLLDLLHDLVRDDVVIANIHVHQEVFHFLQGVLVETFASVVQDVFFIVVHVFFVIRMISAVTLYIVFRSWNVSNS
jgi:hypothetical protein